MQHVDPTPKMINPLQTAIRFKSSFFLRCLCLFGEVSRGLICHEFFHFFSRDLCNSPLLFSLLKERKKGERNYLLKELSQSMAGFDSVEVCLHYHVIKTEFIF